jgi:transcriptional regulator with GAF, ATPase, and Fis domain
MECIAYSGGWAIIAKLLRVIQDCEVERRGSPRTIKVNVRIIASSNLNLKEEIRAGRFREDLFYRLNVFPITIPPIRQRKENIPLLVNHFVANATKK